MRPLLAFPGPPGRDPESSGVVDDLVYAFSYRVRAAGGEWGEELPYVSGASLNIRNDTHQDRGYEIEYITRRYTPLGVEVLPESRRSVFFILLGRPLTVGTITITEVSVTSDDPTTYGVAPGTFCASFLVTVTLSFSGDPPESVNVTGTYLDLPGGPLIPLLTEDGDVLLTESLEDMLCEESGNGGAVSPHHLAGSLAFTKVTPTRYQAAVTIPYEQWRSDYGNPGIDMQFVVNASPIPLTGYRDGDSETLTKPGYWVPPYGW